MPAVYRYMVGQGVSDPNFTDADPLCCSFSRVDHERPL
jgi:hypothetical protein